MKLIVTAGGQGTKLWPYSRNAKPKQFQTIIGEETLFSYTINLLLKAFEADDIFISTKRKYMGLALEQAPQLSPKNFIIEPDIAKDRGPGEGLAFLTMEMEHPNEPFMIVQCDCLRIPEKKFLDAIQDAGKLVERDKKFISGGIKATYPVLGIDYLKIGNKVPLQSKTEFYQVEEFIWRIDDYYKTKELIENFHITTHSNHTCWYPHLMLEAYKKYRPDWYEALMKIRDVLSRTNGNGKQEIEEIYAGMEKGPTEEVMQHLFPEGYIILLPYKWIDIGAWNSIYEYFAKEDEVYQDGNVLALDSKRTLIKNGNKNKLIAVYGVENLVIIDTDDILLIIPADKVDKIKHLQNELHEKGLHHYL